MSTPVKIRPAIQADLPWIGAIAEATDLFPGDLLGDMIAQFLSGESSDLWFVYERDGEVLSFVFCEPERMTEGTWNLLAIGVVPSQQGKGIGAAMMDRLEEKLRAQGERILLVETMGTPELERTREFYRKNDYTEEARIREFYEAGADKVVFWKKLS